MNNCPKCGNVANVIDTYSKVEVSCKCGFFSMKKKPLWQAQEPILFSNATLPKRDLNGVMIKQRFGFEPSSVWYVVKDKTVCSLIDDNNYDIRMKRSDDMQFSEFNPVVAEQIIKFWSNEGDLIIDPFSGRATRGFVARMLKRDYVGYDISPSTVKWVTEQLERTKCESLSNFIAVRQNNNDITTSVRVDYTNRMSCASIPVGSLAIDESGELDLPSGVQGQKSDTSRIRIPLDFEDPDDFYKIIIHERK